MEQISNRSYVKHGFLALASSQCTPCTPPPGGGNDLGLGCSDTYGAGTNASNFWLGPPDEIDAFNGAWDPNCSLFDLGLSGTVCDGNRSYDGTGLGPLGNRVKVHDDDLDLPGATYWFQAYYVVKQELESVRRNNFHSRRFTASLVGNSYNINEAPAEVEPNRSVTERWIDGPNPADLVIEGISSPANVVSGTVLDGSVYVAYQVTEPSPGVYHYEYAVHNRDNARGVGRFELPLCPGASISNFGTSDTTLTTGDDWSASISADDTTLVIEDTSGTNDIRWNNLFNFWFDSNAAPAFGNGELVAANPGPGNDSINARIYAPSGSCQAALIPYGCAVNDCDMTVTGTPALGQAVNYELDNPALSQEEIAKLQALQQALQGGS